MVGRTAGSHRNVARPTVVSVLPSRSQTTGKRTLEWLHFPPPSARLLKIRRHHLLKLDREKQGPESPGNLAQPEPRERSHLPSCRCPEPTVIQEPTASLVQCPAASRSDHRWQGSKKPWKGHGLCHHVPGLLWLCGLGQVTIKQASVYYW